MGSKQEPFAEAAKHWDLETLYADLASVKGKRLTPVEKLHLRGLLCGHSPAEIAEKLDKDAKGVQTDLCATLYKYVKSLLDKSDSKLESWRSVTDWLEQAGYRSELSPPFSVSASAPENTVVNVTNVGFENNQIKIGINLQITVPLPSDLLKDNPLKDNPLKDNPLKDNPLKDNPDRNGDRANQN
jgi:hypothetical protein